MIPRKIKEIIDKVEENNGKLSKVQIDQMVEFDKNAKYVEFYVSVDGDVIATKEW